MRTDCLALDAEATFLMCFYLTSINAWAKMHQHAYEPWLMSYPPDSVNTTKMAWEGATEMAKVFARDH